MKILVPLALSLALLGAAAASADPGDQNRDHHVVQNHDPHAPVRHKRQVCVGRLHHRHCHWAY